MFLVNLEREGHDHFRAYKCSNCKKTSQFVPLSDAPTLWLTSNPGKSAATTKIST
jgi:hypothetical protein